MRTLLLTLLLTPVFSWAGEPTIARGREVYMQNCVACHGANADGRGPASVAIAGAKPRNFVGEKLKYGSAEEEIFKTISTGVPNTAMPGWSALPEADRKALAKYIKSISMK